MNKNMIYVAALSVLCVLAGVVVGAGIAKRASLPWPCPERPNFSERAESFMRQGPGEPGDRHFMKHGPKRHRDRGGEGLLDMLITKLDLNRDQQAKVKEVLEKARREIDEVGKDVRSTITDIKEKSDKQIMDMLTTGQQQKFKALLEEFKKRYDPDVSERDCGPMRGRAPRPGEKLPPPQDE
ncbi:MAG: hypothetical protein PHV48_02135 [Candidatus Omnitrophica bacterium]|nr:hypothetical protein [Candidatus Omnitrophota bacterium]